MKIKCLMRKIFFVLLSFLLIFTGVLEAKTPVKKSNIRVLYVGGTPEFETLMSDIPKDEIDESVARRMKSFEEFLNDYFTSVTVIKAENYVQEMSDHYDVTIMDGRPKAVVPLYQDRAKGIYRVEGYLSEDFDRPILTIGEMSDRIGRRIGTKHDWYCLCLRSDAHHWRAEHPIFNGPFEVTMTVVDKPTPEPIFSFPHHFTDGKVPETLPMWRVQTYDYESETKVRIGLVSRPGGYEDSPEAEYISGGVCDKSPDAVAIGRHGNFFHWGFAASPAHMTEEAKPVLANAIVYISKFAGQTPIARKYNDRLSTRGAAKDIVQFLSREAHEQSVKAGEAYNTTMAGLQKEALEKQARQEKLSPMDNIALSFTPMVSPTYEQHVRRSSSGLYEQFGMDIDAYRRYFDENYDYFYCPGTSGLEVDEEAKGLGIPNHDKRILDEAIKMLESGSDIDKGRRILTRYTLVDFATPAEWRAWYKAYQERLFFTESGGWFFLVNSREPGVNDYKAYEERRVSANIKPGETSDTEPVAITADVTALQDGSRMLGIKVVIHPGYHIYQHVASSDVFLPTKVEVLFPDGYRATGDLRKPAGNFYNRSGTTIYRDIALFSQKFSGSGKGELRCKITYQCCDINICFPPCEKEIVLQLE